MRTPWCNGDPLIGSVHDPIYQGAGPMGMAGIPQPKPGAVTRAHGGILFLDEIGELHPVQMNKLLKVLEDRKVFLESAYYNADDPNLPSHIQDIFENGLPADFRLVGATTRSPEEIPAAIRSRCLEVFFHPLERSHVQRVAATAAGKLQMELDPRGLELVSQYATNGREAVNIIQTAAGLAITEGRRAIGAADVAWVVTSGQLSPRPDRRVGERPEVGVANGLAVYGPHLGLLLEVEVVAERAPRGRGRLTVTGIVDEEEVGAPGHVLKRRSMAHASVANVLTALRQVGGMRPQDHHLHVNFPGGMPVDGPSAGLTIAVAVASALDARPVDNSLAMTGEVSVRGLVRPVGGVAAKLEAARQAGAQWAMIPDENLGEGAQVQGIRVVGVSRLVDALDRALLPGNGPARAARPGRVAIELPLSASPPSAGHAG